MNKIINMKRTTLIRNIINDRCRDIKGIAVIHVILLVLIAAIIVVILIPVADSYVTRSDAADCRAALDTAWRQMRNELIYSGEELEVDVANSVIARTMPARYNDSLCPVSGTIYLVKDSDGGFTPVCGLHDPDTRERVRLNASYAKAKLSEALDDMDKASRLETDKITIDINGGRLDCVKAEERPNIRRGTDLTKDYDGIVAFYGLNKKGKLSWFLYADENHCAYWNGDIWSGDSYGDTY